MRDCCYKGTDWKILLVDDEEDVILITRLALQGYTYYDRGLEFLTARSAKEAMAVLNEHDDIAVIFLDIIMEHDRAGFDVIEHLRNVQENFRTRVVIRTGEPGEYPEATVVHDYEINDYKSKGELTEERLNCTVATALRSYCDLLMLESYKNTESSMIHKSKLMLFGEMMGMMLHQWQQPITSIGLNIDLIKETMNDYDLPEAYKKGLNENIQRLSRQVTFLGGISKDFRAFFKASQKEHFSVTGAVKKTLLLIGDLLEKNDIQVELLMDQDIKLFGHQNEFKHVILNLIKNSMDAYEKSSRKEKKILLSCHQTDSENILTYIDSAGGIKEAMLPHKIFEPYSTSKKDGSGIGLWMCKLIVENMDGKIRASNEKGGARFEMVFPLK